MATQRILLLRHAEGEHNLLEMLEPVSAEAFTERQHINVGAQLTPKGLAQAEEAADQLMHEGIDHIVVSPFDRTLDTARPLLSRLGVEPQVWVELSEILPAGLPPPVMTANTTLPAFLHYGLGFASKLFQSDSPGVAETVGGAWLRASAALWRLGELEGTVLAVTHGGMIGAMVTQAALSGHWRIKRASLENAGISEFVRR